jgi:peroxiredoxin Q/BCP
MQITASTWERVAPRFLLATAAVLAVSLLTARAASRPKVGEVAPNFTLNTLEDKPVELKQLTAKTPVVLVVLRGWPGYQCPICTRQVQDFARKAAEFDAHDAQVVMVYPGPADDLKAHAREFLQNKEWPKDFLFVIDPDYAFTNAYGLRWEATKVTAYPSTFIAKDNKVRFAHVSTQHGDRVDSATVLRVLEQLK